MKELLRELAIPVLATGSALAGISAGFSVGEAMRDYGYAESAYEASRVLGEQAPNWYADGEMARAGAAQSRAMLEAGGAIVLAGVAITFNRSRPHKKQE